MKNLFFTILLFVLSLPVFAIGEDDVTMTTYSKSGGSKMETFCLFNDNDYDVKNVKIILYYYHKDADEPFKEKTISTSGVIAAGDTRSFTVECFSGSELFEYETTSDKYAYFEIRYKTLSAEMVVKNDTPKAKSTPYTSSSYNTYREAKYYLAETTTVLNLRSGPSTTSDIVTKMPSHSYVLVVDYGETFCRVIYIDKDLEGYVHRNYIRKVQDVEVNENGALELVGEASGYSPEVEIENNTSMTMTLRCNRVSYTFKPHEKRTITLNAGTVDIMASSPGVIPFVTKEKLENNYRYSWVFYIKTVYN